MKASVKIFTRIVILTVILILSSMSVSFAKTLSLDEVTSSITNMKSIYNGKCWNGNLSESSLISAVNSGYSNPSKNYSMSQREQKLGLTNHKCGYYCKSNQFGSAWQCMGFARYMEYVLFEAKIPTASSMKNGGSKNGFTKYEGSLLKNISLQPGDYIRVSGHSAVIWKIENGQIYVADCWGGGSNPCNKCNINWGFFGGYSNSKTPTTLMNKIKNNEGHVIRPTAYISNANSSVAPMPTPAPTKSTLNINLTSYPTTINFGSPFGLRGDVTSNYNLTSVNGYIITSKGETVQDAFDKPTTKSVDIRYLKVNQELLFDKLPAGNYTLRITAWDTSGANKVVDKKFTVKGKTETSTLKIDLTQYPTNIKKGKAFGLRGSVTSNYNLTSVNGYILNSKGETVQDAFDKPTTKSVNIRYLKVNQELLFDKLPAGNYTLRITAWDEVGANRVVDKKFTVK